MRTWKVCGTHRWVVNQIWASQVLLYLLDTNVVSEPSRSRPDENVVARLREHAGQTAIPSIVWHELIYGIERLRQGKRRTYLASYLTDVVSRSQPVLPYGEEAALWHGRERARLEHLGRPRPFADGMIAAVAATHDLTLVTRDTGHFESFRGLRVENWHV
jgi:tRNA(fMet)-specific endonuclease VapC